MHGVYICARIDEATKGRPACPSFLPPYPPPPLLPPPFRLPFLLQLQEGIAIFEEHARIRVVGIYFARSSLRWLNVPPKREFVTPETKGSRGNSDVSRGSSKLSGFLSLRESSSLLLCLSRNEPVAPIIGRVVGEEAKATRLKRSVLSRGVPARTVHISVGKIPVSFPPSPTFVHRYNRESR